MKEQRANKHKRSKSELQEVIINKIKIKTHNQTITVTDVGVFNQIDNTLFRRK